MISSQQLVVGWIEYAIAGTVLLAITSLVVRRLSQPVDRVNLIAISFVLTALVPLLLCFVDTPGLRLGILSSDSPQEAGRLFGSELLWLRHQQEPIGDSNLLAEELPLPLGSPDAVRLDAGKQSAAMTTSASSFVAASGSSDMSTASDPDANNISTLGWDIAAVVILLSHGLALAWFALQWTLGTIRLRGISSRAHKPELSTMQIWQEVSHGRGDNGGLRVTTEIATPIVFNWRHPVVLIPESIVTGTPSALRFCLSHEWSHVDGRDLQRWHLVNLCQILFWYQPLYWILRRELRTCQDLIADDRAVQSSGDQLRCVEYSELLMSFAKVISKSASPNAIAFYDRTSQLARRIKSLLVGPQSIRSQSTQVFYWTSGLLLLAVSMLVGSIQLSATLADEVPKENPSETLTVDSENAKEDPQQASDSVRVVRGRVINEAGQPVTGAKLWLPLRPRPPQRTIEAEVDEAGNFELNVPTDWLSARIVDSSWTVWAYAPGYSIQSQDVFEALRKNTDTQYTIRLPSGNNASFKVLAPDGQALGDVLVQPRNYRTTVGYEWVPEEMQPFVSARSDQKGLVHLPAMETNSLFKIEMASDKFGRQMVRVDGYSKSAVPEIRLQRTASMKGRLVGENPEWVREVKVYFNVENRFGGTGPQGLAEVVTNSEGRFEVPLIAGGGQLRTHVDLDSKLPVRPILPENVYLTADETVELEIPLVPAPLVQGKVVAKSTGEPVANVEISIRYGTPGQSEVVATDERGLFQARALPGPVKAQIIVLPFGFEQLGEPWSKPVQIPEKVEEFELPTIELVGSYTIAGQLIGADDQPLPDTKVHAIQEDRRYGFGQSDAEGHFKMIVPEGIEPEFHVYIESRGNMPATVVQREPLIIRYSADVFEQEWEAERAMKPDVTLKGRVLMAGEPVSGCEVLMFRNTPVSREQPDRYRFPRTSSTKTDSQGNYRVTGLKAGDRYYLELKPPTLAADPKWHHQSPYIPRLPDDAQGDIVLPDVNLLRLTQSIAGVVVDPDGKPVKGARVTAQLQSGEQISRMRESGPPPWTESDHQGRFHLKELPDAPLAIMAYIRPKAGNTIRFPAKQKVDMNQQDIRIILDPSLQEEE